MKLQLNTLLTINAVVFAIVAIVHLLRIIFDWNLVINNWLAPPLLSIIALLFAGWLAYNNNLHRK